MAHDDKVRILADPASAGRIAAALSRRRFLTLGMSAAGAALLAACGGSSKSGGSSPTTAGATTTGGAATTGGATTTGAAATTAAGPSTTAPPTVSSIDTKANSLNMFTWAEYDDPDLIKSFGTITIDVYESNEDAIAKLEAAAGTSGYDMVVPTGAYIPQMVAKGLLEPLNLALITNFKNLDEKYTNQPWDPGNAYTVCKDWGTTGWIYDNSVITTPIKTWADFNNVAMNEASGKVSVINSPPDLAGLYFWANGIDWNTEDPKDLDAAEAFIVDQLAPHIKAFDSYPGINLTQGNYVLSQVFNGDARQGLLSVKDPDTYTWGVGAPASELWMDNWCIVKAAKNIDAAYNFINFILVPENSVTDLEFHGYHTGIKDIQKLIPSDTEYPDMIFFTDEQVATFKPGAVNTAQQRLVDIYNKAKAKAGA